MASNLSEPSPCRIVREDPPESRNEWCSYPLAGIGVSLLEGIDTIRLSF